jgi:excisionase family DNA binding protein
VNAQAPGPTDHPKLSYTMREASHATGISRTKLYDFIRKGDLPSFKIGRARYVRAEAIRQLLFDLESRSNIDQAALRHARRLLKQWLPLGALSQGYFAVAAEEPLEGAAAHLKVDLTTGAWIDARKHAEAPVKGTGLLSLFAHLRQVSLQTAATEITQWLSINPQRV